MEQQNQEQKEQGKTPRSQKKNPVVLFLAGLAVFLLIAIVGVYVYTKGQVKILSESPFALQAAGALRVPIAKIDGGPILYTEFTKDYLSLKKFYSTQPDGFPLPTDKEIAEQVLSRLFINELINDLAREYDINVTEEDIAAAKTQLLSQFEDEAAAAVEVEKTFGWSLETFTNRVIIPIVLEQKVGEAHEAQEDVGDKYTAKQVKGRHILFIVTDDVTDAQAKQKAQEVLDRIKNGEDFIELAKEFGSDGTAEQGGDLGWIDRGVTVPAFEEVLFSLEPGQLYDSVAETEFGYHIVQADEVRTVNDFPLFFQDRLAAATIKIFADLSNPFDEPQEEDLQPADLTEEDLQAMVEEGAELIEL